MTVQLTVRGGVKGRKGSTEATFEKRVAKVLKELGLFSYHIADKWYAGLPDRYVVGGNWIEFKVVPCSGRRKVSPVNLFRENQRNFLHRFDASGDRTWACVMFQPENDPATMVLMPWHLFKGHGPWGNYDIEQKGVSGKIDKYVAERFGRQFDRFSNYNVE